MERAERHDVMAQDIDSLQSFLLLQSFLPGVAAPSPALQQFRKGIVGYASKEFSHRASGAGARQSPHTMRCNGPACCVVFVRLFAGGVRFHRALARQERKLRVVDVERGSALKTPFASRLRGLLLAVDENPFSNSRLDVDLDQLVENFIQLLSKVGAVVQSGEDKGLEGNFRAVREVLEHRLVCFHSRVSVRQPRAHAEGLGTKGYTVYLYSQYQNV